MDRVLSGLQGIELFVYLDDIVLYASSLTEHASKFNRLAERLRTANLRLQPDKCEFLRKEVTYLGHVINEAGVRPDPKKIIAVKNFPRPRNVKNIKQFLGLAGYYRRFLNNFSKTAKPLTRLLKKQEPFVWLESQESAFATLRDELCTEPLLIHPDFTRPFILTTDASGYAIGGILSQGEISKDIPIAYASRLLNKAEQNYSTIEKESLAIVYCVHGHKGITKTFRRIRSNYYWPNMKENVQTHIQNCRNCQLKKLIRKKTKQPMVLTDTPGSAFDKISMDIMGPIPTSREGNSYILTVQDLLTKYSVAIPLEKARAIDVANALVDHFICLYGAPKALLTDQGTHFLNGLMRVIARKFKIAQYHTTAYRPQANGSVERSHHVLWEYLKQIV